MEAGGDNMENWKEEIIEHIKERQDLVAEINGYISDIVNDLKVSFPQSLESVKKGIDKTLPDNLSNPKWEIKIGGYVIDINLEDIHNYRSVQDEYGNPELDESITIDHALKEMITKRIKTM